jgi:uncharacterized protein
MIQRGLRHLECSEAGNAFGQCHGYQIPWAGLAAASANQSCAKRFFVSPFFPARGRYRFPMTQPDEAMTLSILFDTAPGGGVPSAAERI